MAFRLPNGYHVAEVAHFGPCAQASTLTPNVMWGHIVVSSSGVLHQLQYSVSQTLFAKGLN